MLNRIWSFITKIGIDEKLDSAEARRISYVNYIALLSLLYLVVRISLSLAHPSYAFKLFCMSFATIAIIICNALHFYRTAKFATFITWVTMVVVFSYFYLGGFHGGTFVVLFSAVIWPFMLFNPAQKKYILICLGYLIFCFSLLITLQYIHPLPVRAHLNMEVVRISTTVLTVVFLLLLSWYFHSSNMAAEEELHLKARQMQLITDNSPAYIAYVGANDLRYRFVNKRFEQSYNMPKEDIVGQHIEDVIGIQNYQFALPYIEQVKSGQTVSYDNVFPVKEGKRWVKVNYVPDFDQNGMVKGIVVMSHDITEQKNIEESLRQSEHRYRSLFENMIEGVVLHELVLDDQGIPFDYRILNVNPMFTTHTQIKAEEAIGRLASDLYGTSPPPFFETYKAVAQTGQPAELEVFFKPMEKHFHISTFSPATNQFVTVFENITERKLAQQEMQRAKEYLENVLDSSPDGIGIVNKEGRFFKWNTAAAELYGFSYEELEGRSYREFYPESEKLEEMLSELRRNRFIRKYEIEMSKKDGSIAPFELSISLLKDENNITIGSVCLARDLSETKKTLDKLTTAYDELQTAKETAEAANNAKSIFLANMSHELRTPLNAILGFSELMKRDPKVTIEQLTNLDTIGRSGEHLLSLINDVLEFSKIEAGQLVANRDEFDLHRLLQGLEEMFRLRANQKGLALELILEKSVSRFICTDQNRLRQILINLLGNAIKYTHAGTITLSVAQKKHSSGKHQQDELQFEVTDTGVGIPVEEQSRIFDAFFQTGETSASRQGTGLGLPISQKFVELLGGELRVESTAGEGSRFYFTLLFDPVENVEAELQESLKKVIGLADGQRKFRLLVAEDNENNRALLTKLLRTVGFEVVEAVNGREAVSMWRTWQPDLIWMDIRMPVMDGYEATSKIKSQMQSSDSLPATKIIALTASAFEEDRRKVLACGGDDFVRKPFRESEIFDTIRKHLGVTYLYSNEVPVSTKPQQEHLTHTEELEMQLALLPEDLLAKLCLAAELSDTESILKVIAAIDDINSSLGNALTSLADNFAYDRILKFVTNAAKLREDNHGK